VSICSPSDMSERRQSPDLSVVLYDCYRFAELSHRNTSWSDSSPGFFIPDLGRNAAVMDDPDSENFSINGEA
jgi:hypothetical protein